MLRGVDNALSLPSYRASPMPCERWNSIPARYKAVSLHGIGSGMGKKASQPVERSQVPHCIPRHGFHRNHPTMALQLLSNQW